MWAWESHPFTGSALVTVEPTCVDDRRAMTLALMLLRRETSADVDAIDAVHREAFASGDRAPVEHALVRALRADQAWIPALSIVAEDDAGEVVGHVVATAGRLTTVTSSTTALGIGPVGVRPHQQGHGVGTALMHAVLAAADALGHPLAVLLGDPGFYSRFGFVSARSRAIDAPDPAWRDHFQVRTLFAYAGQEGMFRYPAPFDEL